MAKFSPGVVIGMIRGKVGGGVFTKAKNGATLRLRVRPANPNTASQSAARAALTDASRAFRDLSSGNLQDWRDYAASITKSDGITGSTYHPSAISVFVALATKFLQVDPEGTIPTSPPSAPFSGDDITLTAAGGADQITFTGSADNGAGITTEVLLQKLASANAQPKPQAYKSYGFTNVPDGTPEVVTGLSEGSYSPAYRFVETATGQQSGLVVLPTVVVT